MSKQKTNYPTKHSPFGGKGAISPLGGQGAGSMVVSVFAPATVANLACGFDIFGLAIEGLGDEVTVSFNKSDQIKIKKITGFGKNLPLYAKLNTASVAIQAMLNELDEKRGIDIVLKKNMPLSSGLGSSASSAASAVYAANVLLGNPFSKMQLIKFAMEGERIACGTAHADNVAPSLMGGIVLIRATNPLEVIELPVPKKLSVVVIHPHVELKTKDSRAALPKNIPLKTATQQWGNTAAFVASLFKSDFALMKNAVIDLVAEPHRSKLIPQFNEVKQAAMANGALACSISGSGPSIFALCNKNENEIAKAMQAEFKKVKIKSDVFVSPVNTKGATVLDK
jgi:homoserine kinase